MKNVVTEQCPYLDLRFSDEGEPQLWLFEPYSDGSAACRPVLDLSSTQLEAWNARVSSDADKARIAELEEALRGFVRYFTSGNDIPVERATILAKSAEVETARSVLAKSDALPFVVDKFRQTEEAVKDLQWRIKEIEDNGGHPPDYLYDQLDEAEARLAKGSAR